MAAILIVETTGVLDGPLNMRQIKRAHAIVYGRERKLSPGLAFQDIYNIEKHTTTILFTGTHKDKIKAV